MVDSIIGNSSTQAAQAVKRAQQAAQQKNTQAQQGAGDSVEISSEAAELAKVEAEARAARGLIEDNPSVTLGLDPNFDTRV